MNGRLVELGGRDPRSLSKAELIELERLATWALYCGDDGDFIYADDEDDQLERDDLSAEQRDWLREVLAAVYGEHQRRENLQQSLRRRSGADRRSVRRRPREQRPARRQPRARESAPRPQRRAAAGGSRDGPRPSADDDDDPVGRRRREAVAP